MAAIDAAVVALLRPTEDLRVVLEAVSVPSSSSDAPSLSPEQESHQDTLHRRILAVVSHKDDWNLAEEGSIFICKYKSSPGNVGQPRQLEIQRVFPIYGKFNIAMGQMRRKTLDLRNDKSMLNSITPRSGFSLTITPAEGLNSDSQPPIFFTHDVQTLRNVVSECKRLKDVSEVEDSASIDFVAQSNHFSWLRFYLSERNIVSLLSGVPPDLRIISQPLIDRLSPASAGLPGDDTSDIQLVRDEWVRINTRNASRKGRRRLTLRLGTFNVNGKMPSQDLSTWVQGQTNAAISQEEAPTIPPLKSTSPFSVGEIVKNPFEYLRSMLSRTSAAPAETEFTPEPVCSDSGPDMIVLAFQELDLSTEALIYSTSTTREDAWWLAIFAALGEKAVQYEKLTSKQLVGMLIVVLVKKSLKSCFNEVKTSTAGAGILGVMGNKGGIAVRVAFTPTISESDSKIGVKAAGSTIFTFVNAHLAAFDEMVEKRNSDFQDLSKRLNFEAGQVAQDVDDPDSLERLPRVNVYESDVLFWMGDLNYRIDLPDADVRNILRSEDWGDKKYETLMRYDQLNKAIHSKRAFHGFREQPISHKPTYRFSPGMLADSLGYDMKRKPAYTDRILHMVGAACEVHQNSYTGYSQINMSDHRPVAADFTVDLDLYDKEHYNEVMMKFYRNVDFMEYTHERPSMKVLDTFIDFGKIFYHRAASKTMNIKNDGKIPCSFRFVPAQPDGITFPDWIRVTPTTGLLLPDESMTITFSVFIDNSIASNLNLRPKELSSTLILHTVMGKDHFISLSGEYQYTCFANRLSLLTRLPGPIRSLTSPNELRAEDKAINAPREIMRLVNWMMTSTAHDRMFVESAQEQNVDIIRECLDTGAEFPCLPTAADDEMSRAFGVTLLQLLESLVDPIIPPSLHAKCIEMTNRDEAFEVLDALPPASVNVWISVTAFLHFICKSCEDDQHSDKIARIFSPILLRDDPNSQNPPVSPVGKQKFLLYFIT